MLRVIASSPTISQPVFEAHLEPRVRAGAVLERFAREGSTASWSSRATAAVPLRGKFAGAFRGAFPRRTQGSSAAWRSTERCRSTDPDEACSPIRSCGKQRRRPSPSAVIARAARCARAQVHRRHRLGRAQPGAFTHKQIALLKTFADQAVIAIENARLFNETKEALEQQTASAEILRVIGSSPTDLQPVFEAIVNAMRLSCSRTPTVSYDGSSTALRSAAAVRHAQVPFDAVRRRTASAPSAAVIAERPAVHAHRRHRAGDRTCEGAVLARNRRTTLDCLSCRCSEGRRSADHRRARRGAALLTAEADRAAQTFADQAVIAIENARLFNETKEALERQTAISEVLGSSAARRPTCSRCSTPIAERAARFASAKRGFVLLDGGWFGRRSSRASAARDIGPRAGIALDRRRSATADPRRAPVQIADGTGRLERPRLAERQLGTGRAGILGVPLLREGRLRRDHRRRPEVRPFRESRSRCSRPSPTRR